MRPFFVCVFQGGSFWGVISLTEGRIRFCGLYRAAVLRCVISLVGWRVSFGDLWELSRVLIIGGIGYMIIGGIGYMIAIVQRLV